MVVRRLSHEHVEQSICRITLQISTICRCEDVEAHPASLRGSDGVSLPAASIASSVEVDANRELASAGGREGVDPTTVQAADVFRTSSEM